jgi:hypothetical protein
MLRSLRQLCGKKLGTRDGDIGHVKDFYLRARANPIEAQTLDDVNRTVDAMLTFNEHLKWSF